MNTNRKMSPEEIHNFGVEIVFNQLKKEGYEIESVNTKIGVDPQITATKDGILAFIAVRTACYPEKGKLEKAVHFQMMENAKKFKAIPYFASVGIANAQAKTQKDMSVPIKDSGFHAAYEGLLIITDSEHVKLLDEKNLRDI